MFFQNIAEILSRYGSSLWLGVRTTIFVSSLGTIFGFLIGLAVGALRASHPDATASRAWCFFKKILDILANIYIAIFRGTPMMVQAVFIYYALVNIVNWSNMTAAVFVISINTGAYMAEIIRSGIQAVDPGQNEAARSLGMTSRQTMFSVILPQAVKNAFPAIGNEWIVNIKDSSVLMIISITELMFQSKSIAGSTFKFTETYFVEAVIYFLLTTAAAFLLNLIEKRMRRTPLSKPQSVTDPAGMTLAARGAQGENHAIR
jgi:putative lysine transport system permease protein